MNADRNFEFTPRTLTYNGSVTSFGGQDVTFQRTKSHIDACMKPIDNSVLADQKSFYSGDPILRRCSNECEAGTIKVLHLLK